MEAKTNWPREKVLDSCGAVTKTIGGEALHQRKILLQKVVPSHNVAGRLTA